MKRASPSLPCVGMLCLVAWLGASSAHAQSIKIDWTNERLTIVATDAALADVLTEIASRTGSTIMGLEKVSGSVTIEIRDAVLVDALGALLSGRNYVLTRPQRAEGGAATRVVVWLEGRGPNVVLLDPCRPATNGKGPADRERCESAGSQASGPSDAMASSNPAEEEATRLEKAGFFAPNAPESSLLAAATSPDPGVRVRAVQTLAIQNTKTGRQAIEHALNDENPFVRAEALNMLVSLGGGPDAARRLGDMLEHKDPTVRFSAVMALGEQLDEEAEFQLKRVLVHDDDARVKEMAARLLEQKKQQDEKKKEKENR